MPNFPRAVRTLAVRTLIVIPAAAILTVLGLAAAGAPPALAAAAGTSIGSAAQLTGTGTGSVVNGSDDWWVIYPRTAGAAVDVTVSAGGGTSGCQITATLYSTYGTNDRLAGGQFSTGAAAEPLQSSSLGSDRYYVEVQPWNCASDSMSYKLTLKSGGGGTAPDPARGSVAAGVGIATAWPPLAGHTYTDHTLGSVSSQDWYVLYKKNDTTLATIRVENTTPAGPGQCALAGTLYDSNGTNDGPVQSSEFNGNGAAVFSVPASQTGDSQGRYFLEITNWNCSGGGATYRIEPEPAAQWTSVSRVKTARATAGTTIGNAWPPLPGGLASTHTLGSAASQDWYVLYKKPGTSLASIRIENTTPAGSGQGARAGTLYGTDATSASPVQSQVFDGNGSGVFSVPATETGDSQGRYFLLVSSWNCSGGGATYSIEPEPAAQWTSPARVPSAKTSAGTSIGNAVPLTGGISYDHTLGSATSQDWYLLAKKPDTTLASIRIENTTPAGPGQCAIVGSLYDSHGTSDNPVQSATLGGNGAGTFSVPAKESGDPQGRYYLVISNWNCSGGGATYSIEPEPAAQWTALGKATTKPLPAGPSRTAAGGPLAGGVTYTAALHQASAQDWTYFTTTGQDTVTLRVIDTTSRTAACQSVGVTLRNSSGGTVATAQLSSDAASNMNVKKAGRYTAELTDGSGCSVGPALTAQVSLTPAAGLTGPRLTVTDPALKKGTAHKAYSATITVTGGKKPYAFAAATALPKGLALNKKTGKISGTPAKAGDYSFMITVTDSAKPRDSVTVPVTLTIS
jgi:hypothetical protein